MDQMEDGNKKIFSVSEDLGGGGGGTKRSIKKNEKGVLLQQWESDKKESFPA
jgi:hypothetical protein